MAQGTYCASLGTTRLVKLSAQQVQAFYGTKRREGRLAPASIAHLHAVLHSALGQAERLGLVARTVCDLVFAGGDHLGTLLTCAAKYAAISSGGDGAALECGEVRVKDATLRHGGGVRTLLLDFTGRKAACRLVTGHSKVVAGEE